MTAAELAERLSARRNGTGWHARCPAHEDRDPSLSISEGQDGRVLLRCHAGCTTEDVIAAAGLTMRDLFPSPTQDRRVVATYRYEDEQRRHLFDVLRYEPKDFRQRRADGSWSLGDTRRVLYRLPELLARPDDETVYVAEGEKDVEALRSRGLTATCNPGGAGKWRPEYGQSLQGAPVVVIADADEPGRRHAGQVAAALDQIAASVRVIELPGAKDAAEWLARGGTPERLATLAAETQVEAIVPRLRLLDDVEVAQLPPPEWLLADYLLAGSLGVLFGAPGSGKSFLALAWSLAIAGGAPWLGHATRIGPVVYVYAEGVGGVGQRLAAWREHTGRADRVGVYFLPTALSLLAEGDADDLLDAIRHRLGDQRLALVVIDTLARALVGGDENDAADMGRAVGNADRLRHATGAAVLLVHHSGRTGDHARGSSALDAAADALLALKADADGRRTLTVEKQKDAAPAEPLGLALRQVGASCVVIADTPGGAADPLPRTALTTLRALVEIAGAEGSSWTDWRTAAGERAVSGTSVARARKLLTERGLVERVGGRYRPSQLAALNLGTASAMVVPRQYHGTRARSATSTTTLEGGTVALAPTPDPSDTPPF